MGLKPGTSCMESRGSVLELWPLPKITKCCLILGLLTSQFPSCSLVVAPWTLLCICYAMWTFPRSRGTQECSCSQWRKVRQVKTGADQKPSTFMSRGVLKASLGIYLALLLLPLQKRKCEGEDKKLLCTCTGQARRGGTGRGYRRETGSTIQHQKDAIWGSP